MAAEAVGRNGVDWVRAKFSLIAAATFALWVAYAAIFGLTEATPLLRAISSATANVAPLALCVWLAIRVQTPIARSRRLGTRLALQGAASLAFTLIWYAGIGVLLGLFAVSASRGFAIAWLSGPALPWQLFQGIAAYVAIAAGWLAARPIRPIARPAVDQRRLLARSGGRVTAISLPQVVMIGGARDYSEIRAKNTTYLASKTLADFETELADAGFVRVHRSALINLDHLRQVAPIGGGRFALTMSDGSTAVASRNGGRRLRSLFV